MAYGAEIPLGEAVHFDVTTHVASSGAVSDADSTPTFEVFEEATDTDIGVGGNLTKRTSKTGDYRGTFTASTGNGFEVGKFYSVIVSATVSSITAKFNAMSFRVKAAEAVVGAAVADTKYFNGTVLPTPSVAGIPLVEAASVTIDEDAIADAVIAAFRISGSAASAGATLASADVDVFNQALDLLKEAPITTFADGTPEADWGLRNYITSRNAELREHPWKFAIKRRILYATDFVLDDITATLTGAWATFRLTGKWDGDLVTIRRSSDDTTDDFGLETETADDGDVSVVDAIELDTDAVATFVGSGSGYFSQFYDQSGNGHHLVQATTTKQPLYVDDAGANDRIAASFDGTDDILATSAAMSAMMSVSTGYLVIAGLIDTLTLDDGTATSNHLLIGDASSKLGVYVRLGGTLYGVNDDGSADVVTEAVPRYVPFIVELRHDTGIVYTRVNGGDEDSATSGDTSSLAGALNIGDLAGGSQALDFKMFAAMTFSTIPTLAERDRIVDRLMRYVAVPGYKSFGWQYRYPVPSDCIRMLPFRADGEFEGRNVPFEIEGGYILTDQSSPLYSRYISTFSDAAKFDPLFVEALAARLAAKAAHWFTGKMAMVQLAMTAYNNAIERAATANSLESTDERPADEDPIDQRYDVEGVR